MSRPRTAVTTLRLPSVLHLSTAAVSPFLTSLAMPFLPTPMPTLAKCAFHGSSSKGNTCSLHSPSQNCLSPAHGLQIHSACCNTPCSAMARAQRSQQGQSCASGWGDGLREVCAVSWRAQLPPQFCLPSLPPSSSGAPSPALINHSQQMLCMHPCKPAVLCTLASASARIHAHRVLTLVYSSAAVGWYNQSGATSQLSAAGEHPPNWLRAPARHPLGAQHSGSAGSSMRRGAAVRQQPAGWRRCMSLQNTRLRSSASISGRRQGEWADSGGWATWQASRHRRQRWSLEQAHTALPLRMQQDGACLYPTPIALCTLPHGEAQGCRGLVCGAGPAGQGERARRAVTAAGTASRQLSVRPAAQPDAGRSQFAAHLARLRLRCSPFRFTCSPKHSTPLPSSP